MVMDLEQVIKYKSEIIRFIEILELYGNYVDFWMLRGCVGYDNSVVNATIRKGENN